MQATEATAGRPEAVPTPPRKMFRIEYEIRPDVDLDELRAAIAEFVAGIAALDPRHRYTSYQQVASPRRFVHVADVAEDGVAALQAAPFFARFTAFLRERCLSSPDVTALTQVASTHARAR